MAWPTSEFFVTQFDEYQTVKLEALKLKSSFIFLISLARDKMFDIYLLYDWVKKSTISDLTLVIKH